MADKTIASVIGFRDFPVKLKDEDGNVVNKVLAVEKGRQDFTEEEYEALLKNKGFKKLLEIGSFSEPSENVVKHDAKVEKLEDKHKAAIEKLEADNKVAIEKAVKEKASELGKIIADLKSQLEKANGNLITSETENKKLRDQVAILKKGGKK